MRDISKDPRTNAKTQESRSAKYGNDVSKKSVTIFLHRNGLKGQRQRKFPLPQKRHLLAILKYAKNNLEKDYAYWKYQVVT